MLSGPPGRRRNDDQCRLFCCRSLAQEESDNPDLRDRGYIYWRLLSTDPEAARAVVLAEKPNIADDTYSLEPEVDADRCLLRRLQSVSYPMRLACDQLLTALITDISTLASIYHKPASAFVMKSSGIGEAKEDDDEEYEDYGDEYDGGAEEGGLGAPAEEAGPVDLLGMSADDGPGGQPDLIGDLAASPMSSSVLSPPKVDHMILFRVWPCTLLVLADTSGPSLRCGARARLGYLRSPRQQGWCFVPGYGCV